MGKIRSLKQVFDEVAEINSRHGTGGGGGVEEWWRAEEGGGAGGRECLRFEPH